MTFDDLRLAEPIRRAVASAGYTHPTPIQAQAIPHVLDGRDILGCARTGTGKTAAFALPILNRLAADGNTQNRSASRRPRALVLCPTRELAGQIADNIRTYGRHMSVKHVAIYGGVSQHPQVKALKSGVDVIIATPGRLMDLMQQGHVDLRSIEFFVLDESDQMLDMGFIDDIRRLAKQIPAQRQTLLFSATMPPAILSLAKSIVKDPVRVHVDPVGSTVDRVEQSAYVVRHNQKSALLAHLITDKAMERALIFTRTKHGADRVVKSLNASGIRAEAIHGNKSQNVRSRALASFRSSKPPVLVATDIASRGIDVDNVTHVVNYDLPGTSESYVHRIGRTARAGASGVAIAFCDPGERKALKAIERGASVSINVNRSLPDFEAAAVNADRPAIVPNESAAERPARPHRGRPGGARSGGQASGGKPRGGGRPAKKKNRSATADGSSRQGRSGRPGGGRAKGNRAAGRRVRSVR